MFNEINILLVNWRLGTSVLQDVKKKVMGTRCVLAKRGGNMSHPQIRPKCDYVSSYLTGLVPISQ